MPGPIDRLELLRRISEMETIPFTPQQEVEFIESVRIQTEKDADELLAKWRDRPFSTAAANGYLRNIGQNLSDPWIRAAIQLTATAVFGRKGAL